MDLTTTENDREHEVSIRVGPRFDFNIHGPFRNAYRYRQPSGTRYVIDLFGTEYMDSSALGMLLLLRQHAGGDRASIRIVNVQPAVREILEIANFQRLFDIR